MQVNRKILLLGLVGIVAFVLLIVAVVACSPKGDGGGKSKVTSDQVTLTYWRLWDDKEKLDPIIEEYEKEHKNIKIEYKKLTIAEYEKMLLENLAAGKGPDLFSIHNSWMPKYFDKIAPMPSDMLSVRDYEKQFFKVVVDDTVRDNRIHGIPYSVDTLALYVNTELLDQSEVNEPPKTWDDLVGKPGDPSKPGILGKLNRRQGNTFNQSAIALGNSKVSRASDILALMMLQQKTEMVAADKDKALFNLTQKIEGKDVHLGTEALKFYTSFADPRTANYSWNAELGDSVRAFAGGKTAMMIGFAYNIPTIERLNPNLKYEVVPVPQIGGQDPLNYAGYWTEVVSKSGQHQTEAWDFIKFVSARSNLPQYNEATKTVSGRKDAPAPGKLTTFYEQAATAVSWYKGDYQKADAIFIDMINQVLGGEDPQRAIDSGANRMTEALRGVK